MLLVVVVAVVGREDNTVYLIQVSPPLPPELFTKPLLLSVNMATDKQELSHHRPVQ